MLLLLILALEEVDEDGDHDHDTLDDKLPGSVNTAQVHDIVQDSDDDYAEYRTGNTARSA